MRKQVRLEFGNLLDGGELAVSPLHNHRWSRIRSYLLEQSVGCVTQTSFWSDPALQNEGKSADGKLGSAYHRHSYDCSAASDSSSLSKQSAFQRRTKKKMNVPSKTIEPVTCAQ